MLEEQPLGQFYVLYCLRKDTEENTALQNLIIRRHLVSSTDANSETHLVREKQARERIPVLNAGRDARNKRFLQSAMALNKNLGR
jgi:hypothetical protein